MLEKKIEVQAYGRHFLITTNLVTADCKIVMLDSVKYTAKQRD